MFTFELDNKAGIVRSHLAGFWSADEAERYVAELLAHAPVARARYGHLKFLVDARELPVQPAEVSARLVGLDAKLLHEPGDRFACVVATSLLKIQAQRTLTMDAGKIFVSENAALTWLLAFVAKPA